MAADSCFMRARSSATVYLVGDKCESEFGRRWVAPCRHGFP